MLRHQRRMSNLAIFLVSLLYLFLQLDILLLCKYVPKQKFAERWNESTEKKSYEGARVVNWHRMEEKVYLIYSALISFEIRRNLKFILQSKSKTFPLCAASPIFFSCLRQGFSPCQRTTLNSFKFDNFIFSSFSHCCLLCLLKLFGFECCAARWKDLISEKDMRLRRNLVDNVVMSWRGSDENGTNFEWFARFYNSIHEKSQRWHQQRSLDPWQSCYDYYKIKYVMKIQWNHNEMILETSIGSFIALILSVIKIF